MDKMRLFLSLIFLLFILGFGIVVSAATIYVPDNYSTIQGAVDAANSGDTIIVRDGTYIENVIVNKDHLILRSENGAQTTTIEAANTSKVSLKVSANYVTIQGFTIKMGSKGIFLRDVSHCNILDDTVLNNWDIGIHIRSSSSNTLIGNTVLNNNGYCEILLDGSSDDNILTNNTISHNSGYVIHFLYSSNNTLTDNTISGNSTYGIYLEFSCKGNILKDNTISGSISLWDSCNGNTLTGNTLYSGGISLESSSNNNLYWNTINGGGISISRGSNNTLNNNSSDGEESGINIIWSDNNTLNNNTVSGSSGDGFYSGNGIYLHGSNNNTLNNNILLDNDHNGIYLASCSNNILINNTVSGNSCGICLSSADSNTLNNNTILTNSNNGIFLKNSSNGNDINSNTVSGNSCGIYLGDSSYNMIYLNNFTSNIQNVSSINSTNVWRSPKKITYTYSNNLYTNYLGNYWDDYVGEDIDNNGIGDTPYSIDSDNDNYPLIESFENYTILATGPKLVIYPNPCYPNKGQVVTIANLPLNSKVYIYTISGELVRVLDDATEITTEGGSAIATWDLRNENGQKVARGIYIYFVPNAPGNTKNGKIAVIK